MPYSAWLADIDMWSTVSVQALLLSESDAVSVFDPLPDRHARADRGLDMG